MAAAGGQRQIPSFEHRKTIFLGKLDQSAAGHIDEKAVEVCDVLNRRPEFFTTSSCAGRCFLWRGQGVKSTTGFARYRVSHDLVPDPAERYFHLSSLSSEAEYLEGSGGGLGPHLPVADGPAQHVSRAASSSPLSICWGGVARWLSSLKPQSARQVAGTEETWLRFEPFILHICCRDFQAAAALIAAARTVFKNVGLQGWGEGKLIVAIWGDEGLDMPLTLPDGTPLFEGHACWLQRLANERHARNWAKIDRFTAALREMPQASALRAMPQASAANRHKLHDCLPPDERGAAEGVSAASDDEGCQASGVAAARRPGPRRFDVVGDVAVLNCTVPPEEREAVGKAILAEARQAKVVVVRSSLGGDHRSPGGFDTLAGWPRWPLITTHTEFGVRYVVDLGASFFTTRMAAERQRLCQQVQTDERILVAFAGCGPEALQLTAKASTAKVTAVELNPAAVKCARRGAELLQRSFPGSADRLRVLEGDVRDIAPQMPRASYSRVIAPRPKGHGDGDVDGGEASKGGDGGAEWLHLLLPLLQDGGICHWYDFAADWELPACDRTRAVIEAACLAMSLKCEILHAAPANRRAIAERQYRVVVDFRIRALR